MKIKYYLLLALVAVLGLTSCNSDNIDADAMYTFTGETVYSFCAKTPELQKFADLLDRTEQKTFFSLYGHYTTFAPTNDAIDAYLAKKGLNFDELTREQMLKIVYNSTIKAGDKAILSKDFIEGALPNESLSDRWIVLSFGVNEQSEREIYVNKHSTIVSLDNEVHNGVVHVVNSVVEPSEETLLGVLQQQDNFKLWSLAYEASGMDKGMNALYDSTYVSPYPLGYVMIDGWTFRVPDKSKLGWTMFCEPDSLLAEYGATDLPSLERLAEQYYGSKDLGKYNSEDNPLHKFVAYHILNRQMSTRNFLYVGVKTADTYQDKRFQYYETMLANRLIEIRAGNRINTRKNGKHVGLIESQSNIDAVNGFIHTIKDLMVYDEDIMRNDVLHKRIRFDFYDIPPHFVNNNIRWQCDKIQGYNGFSCTPDFCGDYLKFNDVATLKFWASDGWTCMCGDEVVFKGWYDCTWRMLPVPPGNWEIRLGYTSAWWRGIGQLFIDGQIAGIPKDLSIEGTDPRVGWVADDQTPDDGIENDKLMRNHGYMKYPNSIAYGGTTTTRDIASCLRIIIGQYHFDEYGPHYFRAKNVQREDRELTIDFLEYIPVDMIRDEDRE